ncbi:unnamed protein product [Prunus armeniaca]
MSTKLESESTYALGRTRRSHRDTMALFYSAHVSLHTPAGDYASPENLNISSQDSYPRCNTLFGVTFVLGQTPKSDRKCPEFHPEIRPNLNSKIDLSTLKIYEILPNHQLDPEKYVRKHTSLVGNCGQMTENKASENCQKFGPVPPQVEVCGGGDDGGKLLSSQAKRGGWGGTISQQGGEREREREREK